MHAGDVCGSMLDRYFVETLLLSERPPRMVSYRYVYGASSHQHIHHEVFPGILEHRNVDIEVIGDAWTLILFRCRHLCRPTPVALLVLYIELPRREKVVISHTCHVHPCSKSSSTYAAVEIWVSILVLKDTVMACAEVRCMPVQLYEFHISRVAWLPFEWVFCDRTLVGCHGVVNSSPDILHHGFSILHDYGAVAWPVAIVRVAASVIYFLLWEVSLRVAEPCLGFVVTVTVTRVGRNVFVQVNEIMPALLAGLYHACIACKHAWAGAVSVLADESEEAVAEAPERIAVGQCCRHASVAGSPSCGVACEEVEVCEVPIDVCSRFLYVTSHVFELKVLEPFIVKVWMLRMYWNCSKHCANRR